MSRLTKKKIAAFVLSVLTCCAFCIMTIEGEMRNGNLVSNKNNIRESQNVRDNRNDSEGLIVNTGFVNSVRSDIEKSVNDECTANSSSCDGIANSGIDSDVECSSGRAQSSCDSGEIVSGNSENIESNDESGSGTIGENLQASGYTGIEQLIFEACNRHGIDSKIVLAIARLETGNFTSYAYTVGNNPGGMSVNESPIMYPNIEAGVEAMVSNLANNYFAVGPNTPELIGSKYCPVNASWASLVRGLMY